MRWEPMDRLKQALHLKFLIDRLKNLALKSEKVFYLYLIFWTDLF